MRVLVIGSGVIGIATSYFLHRLGASVCVLDRREGPAEGTSFANGTLLHPSLVDPWNSPGILRTLLKNMGREEADILLRPKMLPSLLTWGVHFIANSRRSRFEQNALKNFRLARSSIVQMEQIRTDTQISYGAYQRGTLMLFRDAATRDRVRSWYDYLAQYGFTSWYLNAQEAVSLEAALAPIHSELTGAMRFPGDEAGDPHRFCTELRDYLAASGMRFVFGTTVAEFKRKGRRISGVTTGDGRSFEADCVVLAAGSDTPLLARKLGLRLPITPVKGYSITLPNPSGVSLPQMPVLDAALRMAVIPMLDGRLRVVGTAEFTGYDLALTPRRVANLASLVRKLYPDIAQAADSRRTVPWCGLRPMSADGVPLIGPSRLEGLFINSGHGHLGWTMAAGSGRLAADMIMGRSADVVASDYAPGRFRYF